MLAIKDEPSSPQQNEAMEEKYSDLLHPLQMVGEVAYRKTKMSFTNQHCICCHSCNMPTISMAPGVGKRWCGIACRLSSEAKDRVCMNENNIDQAWLVVSRAWGRPLVLEAVRVTPRKLKYRKIYKGTVNDTTARDHGTVLTNLSFEGINWRRCFACLNAIYSEDSLTVNNWCSLACRFSTAVQAKVTMTTSDIQHAWLTISTNWESPLVLETKALAHHKVKFLRIYTHNPDQAKSEESESSGTAGVATH